MQINTVPHHINLFFIVRDYDQNVDPDHSKAMVKLLQKGGKHNFKFINCLSKCWAHH